MGHYEFGEHRRRVHAADVHGLRVGRADRAGRRLLRHEHRSTATTRSLRSAAGDRSVAMPRRLRPAPSCPCTSGGATSKAAAASSRFANTSFRALLGVRGADQRELGLRRVGAVLGIQSPTSRRNNYFHKTRLSARWTSSTSDGVPTCRSVVDGTRSDLRAVQPFAIGGVTPDSFELPAGAWHAAGPITQEIYNGVGHRRPRRVRHQAADGHRRASRSCSVPSTAATPCRT